MYRKYIVVLFVAVCCLSGCQSNMTAKRIQAKNPMAKNSPKSPSKMVDVWNTYAQTTPEGKVMRGVAGRVHFYAEGGKKQSVKVDGDMTVFLFDGEEQDPARSKPLKVYQFKAETLPKHYAFKKPLGHGYDFFLPFDELGGVEKSLCIMARFDDRLEGDFVIARPVNTILKGTKPVKETPETSIQEFLASSAVLVQANRDMADQVIPPHMRAIQQVGYENEKTEDKKPEERAVATISLNDHMARRLAAASNQPEPPSPVETGSVSPMPLSEEVPSPVETPTEDVTPPLPKTGFPKMSFPRSGFPTAPPSATTGRSSL